MDLTPPAPKAPHMHKLTPKLRLTSLLLTLALSAQSLHANDELLPLWPQHAPGESTMDEGRTLPFRETETPRVTRITDITRPAITIHPASQPNGMAVLILPGGAFRRVVTDKEGSEIAAWLNQHGITAFVLRYRVVDRDVQEPWKKPLQDAQRAISLIRSRASEWQLNPNRIGVAGFSAGGQAAARLLCAGQHRSYPASDTVDQQSPLPDFGLLIYPWNLWDEKSAGLLPELTVDASCPPTFLVHTHDDRASSLSSVMFYARLRQLNVPAELHVFETGGHGYGLRPVAGSQVSSWTTAAENWLTRRMAAR
ncbi:MAG: Acetylxylan esterase precursor [Planctomycetota bacterium]